MAASAPLGPELRESEEARPIEDSMMIFRSDHPQPQTITERKRSMRLAKSKIKIRKGTLAPSSKGDGRKPLIILPAQEDKQLQKKLVFGNKEDVLVGFEPRCKGAIFSANPTPRLEENLTDLGPAQAADAPSTTHNLAVVSAPWRSPEFLEPSPVSGVLKEEEEMAAESSLNPLRSNMEEKYKSKGESVNEFVYFTENGYETKGLLESGEKTYPLEVSHALLAVGTPMETKNATLLSLAKPVDTAAAHPLLTGGRPVGDQAPIAATPNSILAFEAQPLAFLPIVPHTAEVQVPVDDGPSLDSARVAKGHADTEHGLVPFSVASPPEPNHDTPIPCSGNLREMMEVHDGHVIEGAAGWPLAHDASPTPPIPLDAFVVPLDEFAPLEKGRTRWIRKKFEARVKLQADGSRWPKIGLGNLTPLGRGTREHGSSLGPSAGMFRPEGPNAASRVGQSAREQQHDEIPPAKLVGLFDSSGANTSPGSQGLRHGGAANQGGTRRARRPWRSYSERGRIPIVLRFLYRRRSQTLDTQLLQTVYRLSTSLVLKFKSL